MNGALLLKLRRIAEIGFEIAKLQAESKGLRAEVFDLCQEEFGNPVEPYQFLVGQSLWTVAKSQDEKCKDFKVTYKQFRQLEGE